jgi:hypothetical protein
MKHQGEKAGEFCGPVVPFSGSALHNAVSRLTRTSFFTALQNAVLNDPRMGS